jgi:thiol-disulfide isomerase/thioredoxin
MRSVRRPVARLFAAAALACAACAAPPPDPPVAGAWHAWLDSPGGELAFGLEIAGNAPALEVVVINGPERIDVPRVEWDDGRLLLGFDHYDASVETRVTDGGTRMEGEWLRTAGADEKTRLPFHATSGARPRFDGADASRAAAFDGRWLMDFSDTDDPAIGLIRAAPDGSVEGTVMTTTGDYRYLAGNVDGDRLRLSVFDGAHAFLFDASLQPDGGLAGDFWSRDTWHETWTATRDPLAELPDAFARTRWVDGAYLSSVRYPDLDGVPHALDDPRFDGRVRILEIFGSWCPNCNDAMPFLADLDRRYRSRGLSILGLGFEMTGDFERDSRQLRRYAEHHGIEFPLLVAGVANKAEASKAFPLIDRVRSYPTTIFLDDQSRVRAIHTGYSGPATGESHERMRAEFVRLVEDLLAESERREARGG